MSNSFPQFLSVIFFVIFEFYMKSSSKSDVIFEIYKK